MSALPAPVQRFTSSWIARGELLSSFSALCLLVFMFFFAWFGLDRPPGRLNGAERSTAENAWHGMTVLRWLMLLTILVAFGAAILRLTQRSHGEHTDTGGVVTLFGAVTALLIAYRVLVDLPQASTVVDQKLGAYLGTLSAFGIALGGYESLRDSRLRTRVQRRRAAAGDTEEVARPPRVPRDR